MSAVKPKKRPEKMTPAARKAVHRRAVEKAVATMDSIANPNTGIGTTRSKLVGAQYVENLLLDLPTIETLYQDNDLAAIIIDKIVDDALRAGFTVCRRNGDPGEDEDDAYEIQQELDRLSHDQWGQNKLKLGICAARRAGAGGLLLIVKGAGDASKPLDDAAVGEGMLRELRPFDRWQLKPSKYNDDGTPAEYWYTPLPVGAGTATAVRVHPSRLMFFPGARTSERKRRANMGWDHSVLQKVYDVLRSFDQMFATTDQMFADASQAVFKLRGLIEALAEADGTGAESTANRLAIMDMTRSAARAVFLDAGDEKGNGEETLEHVERTTLPGLDGIMVQYYIRLAAAAGMPLTVLLGMSPAGQDATGDSDLILWFNKVDSFRRDALTRNLTRLVRLTARSLGIDPEEWQIEWPELQRQKPSDQKTADKMAVECLVALITSQTILPEEAAMNLQRVAPSLGLRLDLDARKKAMTEALKELGDREMTGPSALEPDPAVGPKGVTPAPKASVRKSRSQTQGRQAK